MMKHFFDIIDPSAVILEGMEQRLQVTSVELLIEKQPDAANATRRAHNINTKGARAIRSQDPSRW